MKQAYRQDIDGLRAIAVLTVVLNHAKIPGFSGGYVGVDVFFVISGFLITKIIVSEIEENRFSFVKFYERRIRRIVPALSVMLAFVLIIGLIMFDIDRLQALGKSTIASILFYANINFWSEAGYFDAPSQLKPLLHTWSLAVEEQFYIFFPIILILIIRYINKYKNKILFSIFFFSLGAAAYQISQNQATAFYLTQFRVWELIIGSLLAININGASVSQKVSNILGTVGMTLIAVPIFVYTESTSFPGLTALPSVLGTVFVIYGNTREYGIIKRVLEIPLLTFFGKISYSLYLWHWPLLVFTRYYLILPPTLLENLFTIGLIFFISTISWKFIETPFRSTSFLSTKEIYRFAVIAFAILIIPSGVIYIFDGFLYTSGMVGKTESNLNDKQWSFENCDVNLYDAPAEIPVCVLGKKSKTPVFLVWGDSHAPTFGKGIHKSAEENSISGVLTYNKACPPLLDIKVDPQHGDISCDTYNNMVIQYLREHPEIEVVILGSRLTIYLEGTTYKQEEGINPKLFNSKIEIDSQQNQQVIFADGLDRTLSVLQSMGKKTYIIVPIPEIGYDVLSSNYIAQRTGRDVNNMIAPSLNEYLERTQKIRNILNLSQENYGVYLIEPWKVLCDSSICRISIGGNPLYKDDDHLSTFGSEYLSSLFDSIFNLLRTKN